VQLTAPIVLHEKAFKVCTGGGLKPGEQTGAGQTVSEGEWGCVVMRGVA
jgi:hypothetical protein